MAYRAKRYRNRSMPSEEVESESPDLAGPAPTPSEMDAAPAPDEEKLSAFVPMDFFGGKNPKVGDIEKVEVRSIDPESGEVEFVCVYGGDKGGKSMSEQMDEAIPEV